jgi:hypothetical protein
VRYLTGVAIFAMGLGIPAHEHELRSELCRPAWVALGLTNDLYSIDKERAAAEGIGEDHVCNAVWVVQHEYGLTEEEAKELCRQKTKDNVAQYLRTVEEISRQTDVSKDLRIFVESVQYILSGNIVWTLGAPRYHPEKTHNTRQLNWMASGFHRSNDWDKVLENSQSVGFVDSVIRVVQGVLSGVVGTVQSLFLDFPKSSKGFL